jgi:hypothetical protein
MGISGAGVDRLWHQSDDANGCIKYQLAGYFPEHDLILIEVDYWEGASWLLVRADTGDDTAIVAPPHYSPKKVRNPVDHSPRRGCVGRPLYPSDLIVPEADQGGSLIRGAGSGCRSARLQCIASGPLLALLATRALASSPWRAVVAQDSSADRECAVGPQAMDIERIVAAIPPKQNRTW